MRSLLDGGIDRELHIVTRGAIAGRGIEHIGPGSIVALSFERVIVARFDAGSTEFLRSIAHDMCCERARRIDALIGAVGLFDALREDHVIVGGYGAAFGLRFLHERVIVDGHVLVFVCLDDHDHGEVGDEQREEHREGDHGVRDALAERYASEHAFGRDIAGARCDLRFNAGRLIAAFEQEAHGDEACEQRRATLAHEGERKASEGDEARNAADDDECLQDDGGGKTNRDKGTYVRFRTCGGDEAADREAEVEQEQACRAQKAGLLSDGCEDEVRFDDGDVVGKTTADAHAEQAAICHREDGLHELVARVGGVGEGIEPGIDAHLHVREEEKEDDCTDGDREQAYDQVELLAACHVEHGEEHEVDDER